MKYILLAAAMIASGTTAQIFQTEFKIYGDKDGERIEIYDPLDPSKAKDRLCRTGADRPITLVGWENFYDTSDDRYCVYGFSQDDCKGLTSMWPITANAKGSSRSMVYKDGLASVAVGEGLCPDEAPEDWAPKP